MKCTVVVAKAVEKNVTTEPTAAVSATATIAPVVNPTATPEPTPFKFVPPEKLKFELATDVPAEYRI